MARNSEGEESFLHDEESIDLYGEILESTSAQHHLPDSTTGMEEERWRLEKAREAIKKLKNQMKMVEVEKEKLEQRNAQLVEKLQAQQQPNSETVVAENQSHKAGSNLPPLLANLLSSSLQSSSAPPTEQKHAPAEIRSEGVFGEFFHRPPVEGSSSCGVHTSQDPHYPGHRIPPLMEDRTLMPPPNLFPDPGLSDMRGTHGQPAHTGYFHHEGFHPMLNMDHRPYRLVEVDVPDTRYLLTAEQFAGLNKRDPRGLHARILRSDPRVERRTALMDPCLQAPKEIPLESTNDGDGSCDHLALHSKTSMNCNSSHLELTEHSENQKKSTSNKLYIDIPVIDESSHNADCSELENGQKPQTPKSPSRHMASNLLPPKKRMSWDAALAEREAEKKQMTLDTYFQMRNMPRKGSASTTDSTHNGQSSKLNGEHLSQMKVQTVGDEPEDNESPILHKEENQQTLDNFMRKQEREENGRKRGRKEAQPKGVGADSPQQKGNRRRQTQIIVMKPKNKQLDKQNQLEKTDHSKDRPKNKQIPAGSFYAKQCDDLQSENVKSSASSTESLGLKRETKESAPVLDRAWYKRFKIKKVEKNSDPDENIAKSTSVLSEKRKAAGSEILSVSEKQEKNYSKQEEKNLEKHKAQDLANIPTSSDNKDTIDRSGNITSTGSEIHILSENGKTLDCVDTSMSSKKKEGKETANHESDIPGKMDIPVLIGKNKTKSASRYQTGKEKSENKTLGCSNQGNSKTFEKEQETNKSKDSPQVKDRIQKRDKTGKFQKEKRSKHVDQKENILDSVGKEKKKETNLGTKQISSSEKRVHKSKEVNQVKETNTKTEKRTHKERSQGKKLDEKGVGEDSDNSDKKSLGSSSHPSQIPRAEDQTKETAQKSNKVKKKSIEKEQKKERSEKPHITIEKHSQGHGKSSKTQKTSESRCLVKKATKKKRMDDDIKQDVSSSIEQKVNSNKENDVSINLIRHEENKLPVGKTIMNTENLQNKHKAKQSIEDKRSGIKQVKLTKQKENSEHHRTRHKSDQKKNDAICNEQTLKVISRKEESTEGYQKEKEMKDNCKSGKEKNSKVAKHSDLLPNKAHENERSKTKKIQRKRHHSDSLAGETSKDYKPTEKNASYESERKRRKSNSTDLSTPDNKESPTAESKRLRISMTNVTPVLDKFSEFTSKFTSANSPEDINMDPVVISASKVMPFPIKGINPLPEKSLELQVSSSVTSDHVTTVHSASRYSGSHSQSHTCKHGEVDNQNTLLLRLPPNRYLSTDTEDSLSPIKVPSSTMAKELCDLLFKIKTPESPQVNNKDVRMDSTQSDSDIDHNLANTKDNNRNVFENVQSILDMSRRNCIDHAGTTLKLSKEEQVPTNTEAVIESPKVQSEIMPVKEKTLTIAQPKKHCYPVKPQMVKSLSTEEQVCEYLKLGEDTNKEERSLAKKRRARKRNKKKRHFLKAIEEGEEQLMGMELPCHETDSYSVVTKMSEYTQNKYEAPEKNLEVQRESTCTYPEIILCHSDETKFLEVASGPKDITSYQALTAGSADKTEEESLLCVPVSSEDCNSHTGSSVNSKLGSVVKDVACSPVISTTENQHCIDSALNLHDKNCGVLSATNRSDIDVNNKESNFPNFTSDCNEKAVFPKVCEIECVQSSVNAKDKMNKESRNSENSISDIMKEQGNVSNEVVDERKNLVEAQSKVESTMHEQETNKKEFSKTERIFKNKSSEAVSKKKDLCKTTDKSKGMDEVVQKGKHDECLNPDKHHVSEDQNKTKMIREITESTVKDDEFETDDAKFASLLPIKTSSVKALEGNIFSTREIIIEGKYEQKCDSRSVENSSVESQQSSDKTCQTFETKGTTETEKAMENPVNNSSSDIPKGTLKLMQGQATDYYSSDDDSGADILSIACDYDSPLSTASEESDDDPEVELVSIKSCETIESGRESVISITSEDDGEEDKNNESDEVSDDSDDTLIDNCGIIEPALTDTSAGISDIEILPDEDSLMDDITSFSCPDSTASEIDNTEEGTQAACTVRCALETVAEEPKLDINENQDNVSAGFKVSAKCVLAKTKKNDEESQIVDGNVAEPVFESKITQSSHVLASDLQNTSQVTEHNIRHSTPVCLPRESATSPEGRSPVAALYFAEEFDLSDSEEDDDTLTGKSREISIEKVNALEDLKSDVKLQKGSDTSLQNEGGEEVKQPQDEKEKQMNPGNENAQHQTETTLTFSAQNVMAELECDEKPDIKALDCTDATSDGIKSEVELMSGTHENKKSGVESKVSSIDVPDEIKSQVKPEMKESQIKPSAENELQKKSNINELHLKHLGADSSQLEFDEESQNKSSNDRELQGKSEINDEVIPQDKTAENKLEPDSKKIENQDMRGNMSENNNEKSSKTKKLSPNKQKIKSLGLSGGEIPTSWCNEESHRLKNSDKKKEAQIITANTSPKSNKESDLTTCIGKNSLEKSITIRDSGDKTKTSHDFPTAHSKLECEGDTILLSGSSGQCKPKVIEGQATVQQEVQPETITKSKSGIKQICNKTNEESNDECNNESDDECNDESDDECDNESNEESNDDSLSLTEESEGSDSDAVETKPLLQKERQPVSTFERLKSILSDFESDDDAIDSERDKEDIEESTKTDEKMKLSPRNRKASVVISETEYEGPASRNASRKSSTCSPVIPNKEIKTRSNIEAQTPAHDPEWNDVFDSPAQPHLDSSDDSVDMYDIPEGRENCDSNRENCDTKKENCDTKKENCESNGDKKKEEVEINEPKDYWGNKHREEIISGILSGEASQKLKNFKIPKKSKNIDGNDNRKDMNVVCKKRKIDHVEENQKGLYEKSECDKERKRSKVDKEITGNERKQNDKDKANKKKESWADSPNEEGPDSKVKSASTRLKSRSSSVNERRKSPSDIPQKKHSRESSPSKNERPQEREKDNMLSETKGRHSNHSERQYRKRRTSQDDKKENDSCIERDLDREMSPYEREWSSSDTKGKITQNKKDTRKEKSKNKEREKSQNYKETCSERKESASTNKREERKEKEDGRRKMCPNKENNDNVSYENDESPSDRKRNRGTLERKSDKKSSDIKGITRDRSSSVQSERQKSPSDREAIFDKKSLSDKKMGRNSSERKRDIDCCDRDGHRNTSDRKKERLSRRNRKESHASRRDSKAERRDRDGSFSESESGKSSPDQEKCKDHKRDASPFNTKRNKKTERSPSHMKKNSDMKRDRSYSDSERGYSPSDRRRHHNVSDRKNDRSPSDRKGDRNSSSYRNKSRAHSDRRRDMSPSDTDRDRSRSDWRRSTSPSDRRRGTSPSDRRRGTSPTDRRRGRSPSDRGRGRSPSDRGRGRSPSDRKRDRSPDRRDDRNHSERSRDKSPFDKRRNKKKDLSPSSRKRSPSNKRRNRSPSSRTRSPSDKRRDRSPSSRTHSPSDKRRDRSPSSRTQSPSDKRRDRSPSSRTQSPSDKRRDRSPSSRTRSPSDKRRDRSPSSRTRSPSDKRRDRSPSSRTQSPSDKRRDRSPSSRTQSPSDKRRDRSPSSRTQSPSRRTRSPSDRRRDRSPSSRTQSPSDRRRDRSPSSRTQSPSDRRRDRSPSSRTQSPSSRTRSPSDRDKYRSSSNKIKHCHSNNERDSCPSERKRDRKRDRSPYDEKERSLNVRRNGPKRQKKNEHDKHRDISLVEKKRGRSPCDRNRERSPHHRERDYSKAKRESSHGKENVHHRRSRRERSPCDRDYRSSSNGQSDRSSREQRGSSREDSPFESSRDSNRHNSKESTSGKWNYAKNIHVKTKDRQERHSSVESGELS